MFCTIEDIKALGMKPEELDAVTRADDTVTNHAISAAIAEAKGYLKDYDTDTMLAAEAEARNPLFLGFIIDMAVYEILKLSPLNQDLDDRRARWRRATAYLQQVKTGEITPDWPKKDTPTSATAIRGGNPKRRNHY